MEDVSRLVSCGDDIKIWNAGTLTVMEHFNPHSVWHPVSRVCWNSNNEYLVSASSSGDKIVVSSLKSSPIPLVTLAEGKQQTRISLNSTSQFLVSGGSDGTVNLWDLKTKKLHRTLQDHKEEVTSVTFNANDSYIASGSTSGDIVLHSITTNLSSKPFGQGANQPITDLKYSYVKKSMLGSVSDSGTVSLWDANTQKELHMFRGAHKAPASGLSFSPVNELLFVTVGLDKKIICYDTSSKIILHSMRVESPLTSIEFMPDGAGLAVGSAQGKVYLYDLRNLSAPLRMAMAHQTSVTCLRFQNSPSHHNKSSKGSRISSSQSHKRMSSKLGAPSVPLPAAASALPAAPGQPIGERGNREAQGSDTKSDVTLGREAEGQQGADNQHSVDKFSTVGRNSLDIFSPVREDYKTHNLSRDPSSGKKRDELDFLSQYSTSAPHIRTPAVFQTPEPIREEEASPMAPVLAHEYRQISKGKDEGLTLDLDPKTPPKSTQITAVPAQQPFRTPEPDAKGTVPQLRYDTPVNGTPANAAPTAIPDSGLVDVASSLSQRIAETVRAEGGGAPLSAIQVSFIRNMIHEELEDLRDICHRDIVNLQVEMIRQFCIQLNEIHGLVVRYSVNDSLVEEIERLKEENQRLRANY